MNLGEHETRTLADRPFWAIRTIAYESGSCVAGAPTARGSDTAKLCLLPDVERAFSEAHRQKSMFFLGIALMFLTGKIQALHGGSKAFNRATSLRRDYWTNGFVLRSVPIFVGGP